MGASLEIYKNFARAFAPGLANEIWGCPGLERPSRALSAPTAAAYGSVVPVVLGGVYVIASEVVSDVGHGSREKGERVLDLLVKRVHEETQWQRQSAI